MCPRCVKNMPCNPVGTSFFLNSAGMLQTICRKWLCLFQIHGLMIPPNIKKQKLHCIFELHVCFQVYHWNLHDTPLFYIPIDEGPELGD